jgi:hypothetical protein
MRSFENNSISRSSATPRGRRRRVAVAGCWTCFALCGSWVAAATPQETRPTSRDAPLESRPLEFVEVVAREASNGRPVSGARVHYLDAQRLAVLFAREARDSPTGADARLEQFADKFVTDAEGRARVPADKAGFAVIIRTDEMIGGGGGAPEERSLVVKLAPIRRIHVNVADAEGRPIEGAPVHLVAMVPPPYASAVTGNDGTTVLVPSFDVQLGLQNPNSNPQLAVALAIPGATTITPLTGPGPWSSVSLSAPRTGRIEVRLETKDGKNPSVDFEVGTRAIGSPKAAADMPSLCRVRSKNGVAVVPHVALGGRYEVTAFATGFSKAATTTIDGPTTRQATVATTVRVEISGPFVIGRLVDESGRAIADARLAARESVVGEYGLTGDLYDVRTDSEGRFRIRIPVDPRLDGPANECWEVTETPLDELARTSDASARGRYARWVLRGDRADRDADVGTLVFRRFELLAAGRVVHENGAPAKFAYVKLLTRPRRRVLGEPPDLRPDWGYHEGSRSARTGEDGRFELYGVCEGESVEVYVSDVDLDDRAVAKAPKGARDVEIVVPSK